MCIYSWPIVENDIVFLLERIPIKIDPLRCRSEICLSYFKGGFIGFLRRCGRGGANSIAVFIAASGDNFIVYGNIKLMISQIISERTTQFGNNACIIFYYNSFSRLCQAP